MERPRHRVLQLERLAAQRFVPKQSLKRWPPLADAILQPSFGSRMCLTCRWFHHQADVDAIPVLACLRHLGLLSHGELLSRCCSAWADGRLQREPRCSDAA